VIAVDDGGRLHRADGPAFAWLDDIREFNWHGVNMPDFKRVDHDERFGSLWRRAAKGDEAIVLLEVVNSTREPDGSFKHYWLRVPPYMRTAHQASAWTFDIKPAKYAPLIET